MNISVGKLPACLLFCNKFLKYEWSAFLLGTYVFSIPELWKGLKFFAKVLRRGSYIGCSGGGGLVNAALGLQLWFSRNYISVFLPRCC